MTHYDKPDVEIRGYYPGVIGRVTELHAVYYHENWGFDISFETQVGRELSEFMAGFREGRDGFWAAGSGADFMGAIAIDGSRAEEEGARLRWFIVAPGYQGKGIGRLLMDRSIEFCREARFESVYLWTFAGLDAARSLYEEKGFRLTEENPVGQWGQRIMEQKFEMELQAK